VSVTARLEDAREKPGPSLSGLISTELESSPTSNPPSTNDLSTRGVDLEVADDLETLLCTTSVVVVSVTARLEDAREKPGPSLSGLISTELESSPTSNPPSTNDLSTWSASMSMNRSEVLLQEGASG